MADPLVIHDDLELFLVGWFQAWLDARPEPICQGVLVDRVEPAIGQDWPEKLLVVRDDGGADTSLLTGDRAVGLSVCAGTLEMPKPAKDLARFVHAALSQIPSADPDNPVAALLSSNGPLLVPESHPTARAYVTATFSVAGTGL